MTFDRDYHVHTFFSPCADAAMSFARIVEAAEKAGLAEVGLVDHPYRPNLARHHEALDRARQDCAARLRIWIGAELEVLGLGRLAIPPNELPHADYILAAPSHYDLQNYPPVPNLADPVEWADRLMTDMENVPGSGAHAVAHPFFVYGMHVSPPAGMELPKIVDVMKEIRPKRLEWLLERYAAERIALELSPRLCYAPEFEAFIEPVYRRAKSLGIRFLVGSDSHRPPTVGQLGKAVDFAGRLGIEPRHLWHPGLA
jgi:histidinol phosphatase-like PHP family hydrolase